MNLKYINNIIRTIFIIILLIFIFYIMIKDYNKMSEHLLYCEEYCYPGTVIKQFSRQTCVCQTEVNLKYPLDKE